MAQTNPPFMSGVPELLVLRMLSAREMYGYEIVKAMRLVTGEAIGFGEGVIYPVLHALEGDVLDLVAAHLPDIDLDAARKRRAAFVGV